LRFIHQSDIHLRSTTPVNRIDNYFEAQVSKFGQLLAWAEEYEATILCGGDLFDIPSSKFDIYNKAQEMLEVFSRDFYTVIGQHEIFYHNPESLQQTALWNLHSNGHITIVRSPILLPDDVVLHGVGWECVPSEPLPGKFNIFLGHVSVFKGSVPFYWKEEGYTSKTLKEKYPGFDLYLCGDIHSPLVEDNVIVSGPMMRSGIDLIDYRPRAYLIDTDTLEIKPLYYEVAEAVFGIPDKKMESVLNLDNLIAAMKSRAVGRESYKRDCFALAGQDEEAKQIMLEIFNELDN